MRPQAGGDGRATMRLRIVDMDCPSCAAKIRDHLHTVDGIVEAEVAPLSRTLTVTFTPGLVDRQRVQEELGRMGYTAQHLDGAASPPGEPSTWVGKQARIAYASMGLFGLALLLRGTDLGRWAAPSPFGGGYLPDLLLLASALVGGWNFFPKGFRAARRLALDMNFLMTAAILGGIGIGELTEAATIAFLFALAEVLERYSVERARASVTALMTLAPERASVSRLGREVTIPVDEIVAGDVVVLRPGERVPADGRVEDGDSSIDQSTITGESVPVDKRPGDEVFSGTMNRSGFLRVRVTRPAAESALARIVKLVEAAQAERSPTERFVERFARHYTPTVTISALLVMAVPPLLFGGTLDVWFVRGLTLLVIACPCALIIATPVAVVSGITAAARNGVLIKGGRYLEALGAIDVVALDKTGTLTLGRPRVVRIHALGGASELDVLLRASAVEARSEHPIGRALVEAALERGVVPDPTSVTDFFADAGAGARARVGGTEYRVGKPGWLAIGAIAQGMARDLAEGGRTVVGLSSGQEILAWFVLADQPRTEAAAAVQGLHDAGVRRVVMLTGDNATTAEAVARSVGIDDVRAELLPEHKVAAVRALEAEYGAVAMVGDGVNDAPALAAATVGIAMGAAGSDTALETADVALMGDDLSRLPYLLSLSRRARSVIRQNILAAVIVKAVLVVGVPFGWVSLVMAVLVGDMGVSIAVTLNALRLGHINRAGPADGPPRGPSRRRVAPGAANHAPPAPPLQP